MSTMGPEAKSIVDAGRAEDGPDERDEQRVRAAVMARLGIGVGVAAASTTAAKTAVAATGGATGGGASAAITSGSLVPGALTAGSVATVAATTSAGVLVAKIGVVLVVVGTFAVGTARMLPSSDVRTATRAATTLETAVAPANIVAPRALEEPRSFAIAPVPAVPAPERVDVAPVATPHAPSVTRRPQEARSDLPHSVRVSSLASETSALREANDAIIAKDPRRALALLDAYAAQFPQGDLEEESAAARVVALCDAGRTAEGLAAQQRFLAARPHSPLAARVRGACTNTH